MASSRQRAQQIASALVALALVVVPVVLISVFQHRSVTVVREAAAPCADGGNAIVCENSKPGTYARDWDVAGAGDPTIQGYATDISVNVGSHVDFKVSTDAAAYTIDVYRTGYYGGLGARKVATVPVGVALPQVQPACTTDLTVAMVDCGNWAVSAGWDVPADAVSGVYVALLRRADTGGASHITFVVRNDASRSSIVFQTADPTWQAYNAYGGSDFYTGPLGAPNGRAYKLSYNRPFATRGQADTARDFYFSAEYAMVRFLERNGYDVTYQAGLDTDRAGALLLNHETFLSVGHDEYWSGAQRASVEAARDAGVNLAFFTGNEVYWRTRYENGGRTLVSYKETWSDAKIDPSPEWTGTWRDPRFAPTSAGAGLPENSLSGSMYMSNDTDLPVTVSADEGKLRLWRDTGLSSIPAGQSVALAPHTVGYESDEDLDNGSRPAGLIRLSTTTGAVPKHLQDFGLVTAPGTTTHHLTEYRAPSGALVFSAGSIQWAWGLDQIHDGAGAPADPRMQQATVNLLADMGALPASLMTELVAPTASTDTDAPTAQITAPAAGTAIGNGTPVTVTGTAADAGGGVVAGVEVSTDGGTRWHPATGTTAWTYTGMQDGVGDVQILARAIDDSANLGAASAPVQVAVACPCGLWGSVEPRVPASDDATPRELGVRFTPATDGVVTGVRFYQGPGNGGAHTGSLWSAAGQRLATVRFTGETGAGWQSATFPAGVAVSAGQTYTVSYSAPQGHYAADADFFASAGVSRPPLAAAGGFGVAPGGVFGAAGAFPTATFRQSNYFVDVIFTTSAAR